EPLFVVFARFQSWLFTDLDLLRSASGFQFGNAPFLLPELSPHIADDAAFTLRGRRRLFFVAFKPDDRFGWLVAFLFAIRFFGFTVRLLFLVFRSLDFLLLEFVFGIEFKNLAVVCHTHLSSRWF